MAIQITFSMHSSPPAWRTMLPHGYTQYAW